MLKHVHNSLNTPSGEPGAQTKKRTAVLHAAAGFVVGLFILFFMLTGLLLPDRGFSPNENRNLQKRPHPEHNNLVNGSLFKDLSSRMNDQFFLRDAFVSLRSTEEFLLGSRESHGVFIGKDHYLFAKPETPDPEKLRTLTDAMAAFATQYSNMTMHMMLVPCAASVIPGKLPANAPVRNQIQDIADFAAGLPEKISFVDAGAVLRVHAGEQLYYRTDHHWTSLGAKTVFEGCAAELGIETLSAAYDHVVLSHSFLGTLGSQSGHYGTKDMIDLYVPSPATLYYVQIPDTQVTRSSLYDREKLAEKDQYQVFLGGNHPVVEIRTAAETGKNLLLFKDSYANSFVQFLIPYYDRIIMIDPRYYYDSLSTVIRSNSITDVLFLYSANTLFTDNSLTDCLVNAAAGNAA